MQLREENKLIQSVLTFDLEDYLLRTEGYAEAIKKDFDSEYQAVIEAIEKAYPELRKN